MKRGNCRYCGKRLALTKAGRIRRHKMPKAPGVCGGSGQVPV